MAHTVELVEGTAGARPHRMKLARRIDRSKKELQATLSRGLATFGEVDRAR